MNLRNKFNRFCLKNRNKGIPNLMLYVCIGAGLVYLMSLMNGGEVLYNALCFDKAKILQGQIWRLFSYVFTFELGSNPIFTIVGLLCISSLARAMESIWGTLRFNLFYLGGVVLMDVFAMICCPLTTDSMGIPPEIYQAIYASRMAYYLNMTLLIAYATTFPDAQFMIFFVLPVKAWILGLLYLVLNAIDMINLCYPVFLFPLCLFPLVGFGNYLLFFGKDVANLLPLSWRVKLSRGARKNTAPRQQAPIEFRPPQQTVKREAPKNYNHRCTVCGRTDATNPELEFRYCSRCNGYHCYCQDHINNHTHVE